MSDLLILEFASSGELLALGGSLPPAELPLVLRCGEALSGEAPWVEALQRVLCDAFSAGSAAGAQSGFCFSADRLQSGEGSQRVVVRLRREERPADRSDELVELSLRLFSDAPGGIAILDREGRHLRQNAAHEQILGYGEEELAGLTPAAYLDEDQWAQIQLDLEELGAFQGELSARNRAGEERWLDCMAFATEREPLRYYLIHRDMTVRHQADEEARRRIDLRRAVQALHAWNRPELTLEEQLQGALSEIVLVPWLDLSPHGGVYLYEPSEEGALRSLTSVNLPRELHYLRLEGGEPILSALRGGPPISLGAQQPLVLPLELGEHEVGALLLFPRAELDPACRDALAALGATFASLVVRQRVRAALAESEARFRELVASLPGVVYLFEAEPGESRGHFPFISEAVGELYGLTQAEIHSQPMLPFTLIHPDDREALRESFLRHSTTLSDWAYEYRVTHPPGEVRWHRVSSSPRALDPRCVRWAGVIVDVTERKRAEQELYEAKEAAEAGARAKSRFLSTVSHELRTPMNAVIGMNDLLGETELDASQREFVDAIRSSADTLLLLIDDLIDVGRIESERLTLEARPFDLHAVVEESLAQVAPRAVEKSLELSSLLEGAVPERVVGDPIRLRQVLVNLLSNAVKFTPSGEVRLTLRASAVAAGWELEVRVRDTGIGIPPDRMGVLFEPFRQVGGREQGGTGLGLAICRGLVLLMGGRIWCESRLGSGTTFSFTASVGSTAAPAVQPHSSLSGRSVAILDESEGSRQMLSQRLERWGLRVLEPPHATARSWLQGEPVSPIEGQTPAVLFVDASAAGARAAAEGAEPLLPVVWLLNLGQRSPGTSASSSLVKPVRAGPLLNLLTSLLGEQQPALSHARAQAERVELGTRLPLRVLVVEDHRVNLLVATKMLARLGYPPVTARNGLEALERLEQEPFDLVLMDVQMPQMDGLEATRLIRSRGYGGPRVVGLTASAGVEDRRRCLAAGMDDYLSKPVRLETLRAMIERTFADRSPLDSMQLKRLIDAGGARRPELWKELLTVYLEDAPGLLERTCQALEEGDRALASGAAHALKGAALNVGAQPLARVCAEIEARSQGEGDLAPLAESLRHECRRAEAHIRELVEPRAPR